MEDNFGQGVGGVLIGDGKVLLVKHTYGNAKGKYLIPGGYVHIGEMPTDGVMREVLEETGIVTSVKELISMRFTPKNWYAVFSLEYISGTPTSDNMENSEVVFMDIQKALNHENITDTSKLLIEAAINGMDKFNKCDGYNHGDAVMYN